MIRKLSLSNASNATNSDGMSKHRLSPYIAYYHIYNDIRLIRWIGELVTELKVQNSKAHLEQIDQPLLGLYFRTRPVNNTAIDN